MNFNLFKGCKILLTRTECCRLCSRHTKDWNIQIIHQANVLDLEHLV
jgi:hypothetical protein